MIWALGKFPPSNSPFRISGLFVFPMAITDVRVITKDGIQLIHLNHNTQCVTKPDFWAACSLSGPALLARQLYSSFLHFSFIFKINNEP
jgi:hypothetical protein